MPCSTASGTGTGISLTRSRAGLLTSWESALCCGSATVAASPVCCWLGGVSPLGAGCPLLFLPGGRVRGMAAGPCVFWAFCFAGVVWALLVAALGLLGLLCGAVGFCVVLWFFAVVWVGWFFGRGLVSLAGGAGVAGWSRCGFWGWSPLGVLWWWLGLCG